MKVELEKSFPMAASADTAWRLLQDIESVAGCMPGAKVTERIDQSHYKGTISVRIGPAAMAFKGDIEVTAIDTEQRSLHLTGKGSDATGTSFANMDLIARAQPAEGGTCTLTGRSQVTLGGKAAALGGRMMGSVADQLLKQFAANFARELEALKAREAEGGAAPNGGTATTSASRRGEPPHAPANELNGLSLLWGIIRDWFRNLFSRKAA